MTNVKPGAPFTNYGLILAWISNYIHYIVCDEITYHFPNMAGLLKNLGIG